MYLALTDGCLVFVSSVWINGDLRTIYKLCICITVKNLNSKVTTKEEYDFLFFFF